METGIDGAWIFQPRVFGDERGFFLEGWNRAKLAELGLSADFVQDNHSRSAHGVVRGLHYQVGDNAQGKLVWVTSGRVFDVVVDLRRSSRTFGKWAGCYLDAEKHERLWIPPGCAHGFLVLSPSADFHYKCTNYYRPESERSLLWDDPDVGIEWPLDRVAGRPLLSEKDRAALAFKDCDKFP
ncbi:MAG: dTDP-4-dehydrorhamnose 3,5-epimerase [Terrimicrobiaceae bacterium]|nr:dTDP-4-dehydrorhamnose 3,5-epimerase [Terrimicrobiaceae bacterium]